MSKLKKCAYMMVIVLLLNIISPTIQAMAIDKEGNTTVSQENEEVNLNEELTEDSLKLPVENDVIVEEVNSISVQAAVPYNSTIVSKLENPRANHKLTGEFFLKGFAISMDKVSKVEVYLDDIYNGQAVYGVARSDIGGKYPNYPDANNSGFTYKFTGVSNGNHKVKVIVIDTVNNTVEHTTDITVDNAKTSIMGRGSLNRNQMVKMLRTNNSSLSLKYITEFVDYTIAEGDIEGVNYDILFSQMMHETGYLKFGGDVKPEQNNFAGIGATGNGVPGNSFSTVQIGIRAVVQHLKAYASTEALKQGCVDPRFSYVTRASAMYVEHLGIPENPSGKGWAAAEGYGYKLLSVRKDTSALSSVLDYSVLTSINVTGKTVTENKLTVTGTANPSNDTLYKIVVQEGSSSTETVLSNWSTISTAYYTPMKVGNYTFKVYSKHKNSTLANGDDVISKDVTISLGQAKVNSFNVTGQPMVGYELTMTAEANPAESTLYKLWVCDRSTDTWSVVSDYSTKNTAIFKPTKAGKYSFVVHVKNKDSEKNVEDDYKSVDINVTVPKSKVASLNVTGSAYAGSTLTMKSTAEPAADTLYKLWVCDRSTDTWTVLSDYSSKNTIDF
ncbi:glucosaminidase domain-containing protein, partial [Clostridium sp.]|uniref:glucosaminidase domain-containing protein n=1 Tax=Clostridium sp. TaxID=1506 RepID=UPI003216A81E